MKIGIVGTGYVGSTAAYSLALQGVCSELVLVDQNQALAQAHVMDILHATPFAHPISIHHGSFADLVGCSLVILAAGVNQLPGETRMALLQRNAAVFAEIVPQVAQYAHDAILLVATNPLDVMTQVAVKLSQFPAERVLGTGTVLDTARFRTLLSQLYGVASASIHAYVVGEHGDSEVLLWSSATIAGIPLQEFSSACDKTLTPAIQEQIDHDVRRAAYHIINGKGATYYGIGAALARLSRCILYDERAILTTCTVMPVVEGISEVALSLPHVIGRTGIQSTLHPILNPQEKTALRKSAEIIKNHLNTIGY